MARPKLFSVPTGTSERQNVAPFLYEPLLPGIEGNVRVPDHLPTFLTSSRTRDGTGLRVRYSGGPLDKRPPV